MTVLHSSEACIRVLAQGTVTDFAGTDETPRLEPNATLIYLHDSYHEADRRMPLLQHILNRLGHRGAVHALRVQDDQALADADLFLRALMRRSKTVLVLREEVGRSFADAPVEPARSYALLTMEDDLSELCADPLTVDREPFAPIEE